MDNKTLKVTVNKKQRCYVVPAGHGSYSCLGFDVCIKWGKALAAELGYFYDPKPGTMAAYNEYQDLIKRAAQKHRVSGWRSSTQLHPQLIGLEGKRVEVADQEGEKHRFYVGKSTGFIPCHLEIKRRDSIGGAAVDSRPFNSVRIIR